MYGEPRKMNGYKMVVFPHRILAPESKALVCSQYCTHSAWCATWHMVGAPCLLDESRWKVGAVCLGQIASTMTLKPCMQVIGLCLHLSLVACCDEHSVLSIKAKGQVLQTTCSRLEAAVKPQISLYGPTTFALVKG